MEKMINAMRAQAEELLRNKEVIAMLQKCSSEKERRQVLAIAALYSIMKVN